MWTKYSYKKAYLSQRSTLEKKSLKITHYLQASVYDLSAELITEDT